MKLSTFSTLKKLMQRTTSESDNECLSAIRAANRILASEGIDWDRVLSRTVTVINEVEEDPDASGMTPSDASLLEEAEHAANRQGRGTQDFVASIREQFDEKGWISTKQRSSLREVRDR